MYQEYRPNPRIIKKAVQWWVDAIHDPKFDNLGDGPASAQDKLSSAFCGMVSSMKHMNPTAEQAAKFGEALEVALMTPSKSGYYQPYVSVDYGPDMILDEAAKAAGLEKVQFPWKTSMHLGNNYFTARHGYGGEMKYHYPLSGDRWLITSLSGDDIQKIIDHIEASGDSLGLIVEHELEPIAP